MDPLFYAEEFAARRRRYIPVSVNLGVISSQPIYKDYNFPFITRAAMPGAPDDYPELFRVARGTSFQASPGYRPTTRFESMTYQAYSAALADGSLEQVRTAFLNTLTDANLTADMSRITAVPRASVGMTSEFDTPGPPDPKVVPIPKALGTPASRTITTDVSRAPQAERDINYYYEYEFLLSWLRDDLVAPHGGLAQLMQVNIACVFAATVRFTDMLDAWIATGGPATSIVQRIRGTLTPLLINLEQIVRTFLVSPNEEITIAFYIIDNVLVDAGNEKVRVNAIERAAGRPENSGAVANAVNIVIRASFARWRPRILPTSPIPAGFPPALAPGGNVGNYSQAVIVTDAMIAGSPLVGIMNQVLNVINSIGPLFVAKPNVPQHLSQGYLSQDFVNYLIGLSQWVEPAGPLASSPTPCDEILFKDHARDTPSRLSVDMAPFTTVIAATTLGIPSNPEYISRQQIIPSSDFLTNIGCPQPPAALSIFKSVGAYTLEQAYDSLKISKGEPTERYLEFVRFIYIFFDHIPGAQATVAALLTPLVGMYNGIIRRGKYSTADTPFLLVGRTQDDIEGETTFAQAVIFLNPASSRRDAVTAVLKTLRNYVQASVSMRSVIQVGTDAPLAGITYVGHVGIPSAQIMAELIALPVDETKRASPGIGKIYSDASLWEFDLPSVGEAHMLLPGVLGLKPGNILSMIYDLCARWFPTQAAYNDRVSSILQASDLYLQYSSGRVAYTTSGLAGIIVIPPNSPYVEIIPRVPGTYLDALAAQPQNVINRRVPTFLPLSWHEMLYPGYVEAAIVEQEVLRPIGETMVRPCLQLGNSATVFPPITEIQDGIVTVQGTDLEADADIFAAVFEFPAAVLEVILPAGTGLGPLATRATQFYPGTSDTPVGGYKMTRGAGPVGGRINWYLTEALNISNAVAGVNARSSNRPTTAYAAVPLLTNRTWYAWTSLGRPSSDLIVGGAPSTLFSFDAPPSGETLFLPAIDTELFLSSLFDWKLQLHYLRILRRFLEGRTHYDAELAKINTALGTIDVRITNSVKDSPGARAYIRDNVIPNLVTSSSPYAGFVNLLFNLASPTATGPLSAILTTPEIIGSSTITPDTKRFYVTQLPSPARGPLVYDLDIDGYLTLLTARSASMTTLEETQTEAQQRNAKEAEARREQSIASLLKKSKDRLRDDYSLFIDQIVTRAIYENPT
jgi:hypothetical protein